MYYVNILKSRDFPKTYAGITSEPVRRLGEHNARKDKFTSSFQPWDIIYKEEHLDRAEARKREKYYKSCAGRKKRKIILDNRE